MAADYSRIHRLLKILTLIQSSPGWTARRLATECGTTERTVYRDLKMLEGAGIPHFFDPDDKCYRIRRDFFMPPVQLTLDESLSLLCLAEHIGAREQVPFTGAAARAITKIRGQLPGRIRQELEQIEQHLAIQLAAANPPEASQDVFQTVRDALSTRTALRCKYDSLTGKQRDGGTVFRLLPYTLLFNQRAWYVIGHHSARDDVRCLKLSRFTQIQPTGEAYNIPKSFSLRSHLGNAWRMIRGDRRYAVELRFDPDFADTIADTHWHATQEILWQEDESITFRCTVDGLEEIVWWILSMGPHCRVIKPPELVERIRSLASQTADRYSQSPERRPRARKIKTP